MEAGTGRLKGGADGVVRAVFAIQEEDVGLTYVLWVLTKSTPFEKMNFSFFRVASFSCCLWQRPENDIGSGHLGRSSNRQSRFCGLNMKGLRPLHASPNEKNRFVNGLTRGLALEFSLYSAGGGGAGCGCLPHLSLSSPFLISVISWGTSSIIRSTGA